MVAGGRHLTIEGHRELNSFTNAFVREFQRVAVRNAAGGRHQRVFLLDVGANDGRWSQMMMRQLRASSSPVAGDRHPTRVELVMVEPQPRYYSHNAQIAAKWNGTFLPVAAWTEDTSDLPFLVQGNSEESGIASVQSAKKRRRNIEQRQTKSIRAIDFASYLLHELPADALAWLKLDIEGAEYAVLPRLLLSGALCRNVRFLHIEWHLHNLPPSRQAEGLALRKSLGSLLDAGCAKSDAEAPARRLLHEEYRGKNFDVRIPGLLEEAFRHSQCPSAQRCSWQPVSLSGNISLQGVQFDANVRYYHAAKFWTYINGVR